MTKSEALEFLELPETATDNEIKMKVEDKLAYFERLSEKAPSDFLRRLHGRNAAKVSEIQMASRKWPSYIPPVQPEPEPVPVQVPVQPPVASEPVPMPAPVEAKPEPVPVQPEAATVQPPAEPEPVQQQPEPEPAQPEPEPFVQAAVVQQEPEPVQQELISVPPEVMQPQEYVEPLVEPEAVQRQVLPEPEPAAVQQQPAPLYAPKAAPEPEPVGWLIRHTENQSARTFPIYPGKNFMGRKPKPGMAPFIEVEEDPYISRVHAVLIVEGTGPYTFYLADSHADNGDKESKNGTYLNGNDARISEKVRLQENDTIQIGVTKLIIRYNSASINKMLVEVEERDYMHTVVIDIQ